MPPSDTAKLASNASEFWKTRMPRTGPESPTPGVEGRQGLAWTALVLPRREHDNDVGLRVLPDLGVDLTLGDHPTRSRPNLKASTNSAVGTPGGAGVLLALYSSLTCQIQASKG